MIKRAIILILILAGLYWTINQFRDGNDASKETGKKVEVTKPKTKVSDKTAEVEKSETKQEQAATDKEIEKGSETVDKKETDATEKEETAKEAAALNTDEKASTVTDKAVTTEKPVTTEKEKTITKEPVKPVVTAPVETVKTYVPPVKKVVTVPNRETNIKVYIYDNGIDISQKEIPSGTVNFEVVNSGRFSHEFVIGGVKNFGKVNPRTTSNFTIKLRSGEFEVFSDRRDDRERGLSDFIEVVR